MIASKAVAVDSLVMQQETGAPVSPGLRFGKTGEYALELAVTIEQRRRAWAMVYERYLEKGYAKPNPDGLWYGIHDALPNTRTMLVTHHGKDVATLTLVFDSPIALPADVLYGQELDSLRRRGRRLCEITSLVNTESNRSICTTILNHIFHFAYLMAFRVEDATDFVITVNPHHAPYYKRKLFFEQMGEDQSYDKVGGAPATLLRLPLTGLAKRYARHYRKKPNSRSFYRFFVDWNQSRRLIIELRRHRQPLAGRDIATWFDPRRPMFLNSAPNIRTYLRSCCLPPRAPAAPH